MVPNVPKPPKNDPKKVQRIFVFFQKKFFSAKKSQEKVTSRKEFRKMGSPNWSQSSKTSKKRPQMVPNVLKPRKNDPIKVQKKFIFFWVGFFFEIWIKISQRQKKKFPMLPGSRKISSKSEVMVNPSAKIGHMYEKTEVKNLFGYSRAVVDGQTSSESSIDKR